MNKTDLETKSLNLLTNPDQKMNTGEFPSIRYGMSPPD